MSQIILTDSVFYKNGVPGQSKVVGFESGVTRVARYTFTAPSTGATALDFLLDGVSKGSGADIPIRFAITTDPDSHCNAGANSTYTGAVTLKLWNYTAQGSAQVRLLPGAVYYLWLFPGENTWGWYYVPASGTVTTSGIAQGVAIVDGDAYIGLPIPITIHSTPGYTHTLTWEFGNTSGIIGENLGDSVTWTPPLELAHTIPSSQSGICQLTCCSYQDGLQVGDPQITNFTLSVPPFLAPRATVTLTDPTEAASLGLYIEKVSKLQLAVGTTTFYSAMVVSTAITLDGAAYTGSTLTAGEHTLAVTVTDSRGLTGTWEQHILVAAYTVPQLEITASRCRSDGTADDTGDHALVTLRGSVTQLTGNTAALTLRYAGAKQDIPVEVGQFEATAIIPADPNEALTIRGVLRDAIKEITRSMTLSTGYPTMEFFAGGKGIAFGKVATQEGFQCAMDTQFFGKVTDAQGRPLAARYELEPVTGMYLTHAYGRVLELMGAGYLQLKFKCNRYLDAGDQLYTAQLPITEDLTVKDTSGNHSLTLTPTGIVTPTALSTGTYTFSCLLY